MAKRRPNGGGSIYQRKDGRYEAAAYVHHPDGTIRRLRVYADTWDEANKALAKALSYHHAGLPAIAPGGPTLADYLEDWVENIARHNLRASTLPQYRRAIHLHIIPGLGHKRLAKLTAKEIRTWLDTVRATCQCCNQQIDARRPVVRRRCCATGQCCRKLLAPRTLQYLHGVLSAALTHAYREDQIPRNVAKQVQVPLGQRTVFEPFTAHEARTFLDHVLDHPHAAIYEIALRCGLRRGEILGLRWSDVNPAARTLTVTQTLGRIGGGGGIQVLPPKTDSSNRKIALPDEVIHALTRRREHQKADRAKAGDTWQDTGLIFTTPTGGHLEPTTLLREFHRLCDHAKLRRTRFHDLRHACATLMLESGVELRTIQQLLGHANINVTATTYAHVRLRLQHDAINRLGDTLRNTHSDHDAQHEHGLPDNGYPAHGRWDDDEPPEPIGARIR
jgi:integrase